ncbi:ADP-glyceromanno-heptose 6-epimerase [Synoicihabitans lomoniglobus]|uniref:ADP-L-glycero-D-manno-heptose-6-epimerase n=1 Tax=Synoicihabitans lomoniglobus TaxID=2909285 RepID=A0AAF0I5M4_9BACT|nr:ADP-glyceromanno-heptose 6-epimerase [Opitutaceae bacterium LMO-M01]WED67364.1 ADP-glyceromanno-heptose 6-epimerase [Opitutaceae bacterium LMO-M01]
MPLINPRIVITGAAGFIGSRLLARLNETTSAEDILAVDHPISQRKVTNLAVAPDVSFLTHTAFIEALESGSLSPEVIFHMGACSSTVETDWRYLAENNIRYSQRIWEWSAANGRQFIYASSAATYGDGTHGFDDEYDIQNLRPLNLYGKSKHDFDLWVEAQTQKDRARPAQCVGLKFFNVYGPGESHKGRMASMVFHGWNQLRDTGAVRLFKSHHSDYADGGQLRDFIYVADVVDVILTLTKQPQVSGLFNLGTGRAHSFRSLIEELFRAVGQPPNIEYIPMPRDLRSKYQYFTEAKMRKLTEAGISFSPTPLSDAVADYAQWLRANAPI